LYRFGKCEFDAASRSISCRGTQVALRGKVSELLVLLLEQPGEVIPSETLRDRLWPEGFVETGNLAQQIYLLRKALTIDPTVSVDNVARTGYRLRAPMPEQPGLVRQSTWSAPARWVVAVLAVASMLALPGAAALVRPGTLHLQGSGLRTYELGRYFWERRGADNVKRAKAFFEQTIAFAPTSAEGYAGLSEVYGVLADGMPMGTRTHDDLAKKAYESASTAVARDPNAGVAHAAMGLALEEMGKTYAQANVELERAIALDPSNPEAHEWYGIRMLFDRNLAEAARQMEIASELQPANAAVASWHALTRYYLHDSGSAVVGFRTALEINPSFELAQVGLVAALVERGRYREAQAELVHARGMSWSGSRALRALSVIVDLRLGLRVAAEAEADRLRKETQKARGVGDDDGFLVAALVLDGRRDEAQALRAKMHMEQPYQRMVSAFDPIIGPAMRALESNG
jgi:DNA-binding winged helix-turn-helix (wHTH) protein/Tfp pilus assembly protein PilF